MLPLIGAGIAAGANLAGGYMSSQAAKENAQNNMYMQLAFARHGLKWKVQDAKEAGIHPLYALGASTSSYSPVSVGDTSLGSGLAAAGQDIGRALMATRSSGERGSAYNDVVQKLTLTRMGLENDLLASKIRVANQAGSPPAMPGEADVAIPKLEDMQRTPNVMGSNIKPDPNTSDAQNWEDRYGEVVGGAAGPLILLRDLAHTNGWTREAWYDNFIRRHGAAISRALKHYGRR